ncbi:uncharacterized protein DSM5745_10907 [Aspergillus mulundensis]|uniref:Uncharacterized protein n=1 Tax=Aspergillus mulundensis TaxID=1810919 RepID=A0A3D8QF42_9EURO|nr:Uncharacterized protein DSM5745_10907 [Aspergillus mulundensis]RDW60449.1 Uncharacterized protein DSM5745_10907 [Aspergillus mulundensis]
MTSAYTPNQLEAYLERIGYAKTASGTGRLRLQELQLAIQQDPLKALGELQRRHLASIPWGNTAIHYSQHHSISTHPSAVFEKLVVRRLDGYCMENTNLLYVVLRSLGYQAYPTAGRVSSAAVDPANAGPEVRYGALGHMVIIVTIGGWKYMVDVGFGNNGPTEPLALLRNVAGHINPTLEIQLDKEPLPEAVDQSQEFWVYKVRYRPDKGWIPMYAFSETEFLPQDFAMINFNTSMQPSSWFTQKVVCVRHILNQDESNIEGLCVMAGKEVKRRVAGKSEIVQKLETEDDRVEALGKWFGIHLLDHEIAGIRGYLDIAIYKDLEVRGTGWRPQQLNPPNPNLRMVQSVRSSAILELTLKLNHTDNKLIVPRLYQVSDALLKIQKPTDGSPSRAGHLADLTPFSPSLGRNTTGPKIIAPASTIQFIPKSSSAASLLTEFTSPPSENQTFPKGTHWVDNTEPNTIVLISQPPGQQCAVVGGIMAVRMKALGIKGVVVDGRIRDLSEIQGAELPVWAKGTSTVGTGAEAKPGLRNVRVDVGGVSVEPGDIVFCDPLEGVVVIPKDSLDKVLEVMPGIVEADDRVKEAVEGGMSVFEAFKKFRG